ncbi:MAG TPA: glycosyltransferase family A protein [Steroidobacteraceae bacterium]|jgi:glycosyltransferase involved in cell wall biosynthesis
MASPAVSVILPTYNRLQYLRPAVDSVLAQTFPDWELIIADDGSDAQTLDYLRSVAFHPQVRLLTLPHTGNPSVVRNAALREAHGEYVAFLDSDDLWLPRKLEVQIGTHRAFPKRRWSYTALLRIGESGEVLSAERGRRRPTPEGVIFDSLLTLEAAVVTPGVVVHRTLMTEVGGFDEEQPFFEEYDLWLRLNLRSEVSAIAEPLVLVRNHDQHYSADRVGVYNARFRLLDKFEALVPGTRFAAILSTERAKTAGALALVHAAAGHRRSALRMLWRSRQFAWRSRSGWRKAGATAARIITPMWVRNLVRAARGRTPVRAQ